MVANIVGKTAVGGALGAALALAVSSAAFAVNPQFSGPPVYVDPYNAMLGETVPPSVAVDVRLSGRLVYLDPYNATLAAAVLSWIRIVAVDDLYNSFALAPDYSGPRLWEGPVSFDK